MHTVKLGWQNFEFRIGLMKNISLVFTILHAIDNVLPVRIFCLRTDIIGLNKACSIDVQQTF